MCLIEITGLNHWKLWRIAAPNIGHASISIDGSRRYHGRHIDGTAFRISEAEGLALIVSQHDPGNAWRSLVGHTKQLIWDSSGKEIACIESRGLFGTRCRVTIGDRVGMYPWEPRHLEFPGAVIDLDPWHRVAHVEIQDQEHFAAYLGVSFYAWLMQDIEP